MTRDAIWKALCIKFFYEINDEETPGLTWEDISQRFDAYMEKLGGPKVHWVDWGRTFGDYNAIRAGLSSVGREDLMPQRPNWYARPVAWWTEVMQKLKMSCFLAL